MKKSWYGYCKLLNPIDLLMWMKINKFTNVYCPSDMHVTFCYSKEPFEIPNFIEQLITYSYSMDGERFTKIYGEDHQVIVFYNKYLTYLFNEMKDAGASFDFKEYSSHVSFGRGETLPEDCKPYSGKIVLGKPRFRPLVADWGNKQSENADASPLMNIDDAIILARALANNEIIKAVDYNKDPDKQSKFMNCMEEAVTKLEGHKVKDTIYYACGLYFREGGTWS